MEMAIEYIFAKPVNESFYEFGINTLDRMKWIHRDDLRHFISNNIARDIISVAGTKELVESYNPFVIDNIKKEWFTLDMDISKKDITNIVKSKDLRNKELSGFEKVVNKVKSYGLGLDKT